MAKVSPELDPSRDLGVIKTNGTFTGSFTTTVSGMSISYGDGTEETSDNPSHTFTSTPPYIINTKGIDESAFTSISISGNNLTACDVSRYKNLTHLELGQNKLTNVNQLLISLDSNGQTNGYLNLTGSDVYNLSSEAINAYSNLVAKGWTARGLWAPSDLFSSSISGAWYDASDASTITLETGVLTWSDKSGNGYDVSQSTASKQPDYTSQAINGRTVIDFDGNDNLSISNDPSVNALFPYGNETFVFCVLELDKVTGPQVPYIFTEVPDNGFGSVDGLESHLGFSSDEMRLYHNEVEVGPILLSDGTKNIDTPYLTTGSYNRPSGGDLTAELWVDGTSLGSGSKSTREASSANYFFIGETSVSNRGLDGRIAELIIAQDLSETNRQKMEGYLAWKWGLQANLPVSHPYKNIAP